MNTRRKSEFGTRLIVLCIIACFTWALVAWSKQVFFAVKLTSEQLTLAQANCLHFMLFWSPLLAAAALLFPRHWKRCLEVNSSWRGVDAWRLAVAVVMAFLAVGLDEWLFPRMGKEFPRLLVFVIGAAVCEEILFRGVLLRAGIKAWGPVLAILVNLAIVALLHWDGPYRHLIPILRVIALQFVCVILYLWSGKTLPGIGFHVVFNVCMVLR